jgi:VIT1/CCC1 family predicted Fe2+/Mn2+ transporter
MAKKRKTKEQIARFSSIVQRHMESERGKRAGALLPQIILGGQDGLVNVLGIVLGVASATNDRLAVLIAGLVATFAESVSMAAVAYSSSRADQDHYNRELEQERWEIENLPEVEEEEVRLIYMKKGYRGRELSQMVKNTCANREMWLSFMMNEELGMSAPDNSQPLRAAGIVGFSAILGSLVPLAPFILFPVGESIVASLIIATLVLFAVGAYKARITVGNWIKSGVEMALVGMLAALVGYFVGKAAGEMFGLNGLPPS